MAYAFLALTLCFAGLLGWQIYQYRDAKRVLKLGQDLIDSGHDDDGKLQESVTTLRQIMKDDRGWMIINSLFLITNLSQCIVAFIGR